MQTSEYLKQLTAYNLWANTRLAEVLVAVDKDLLIKEQASSFSSIQKTVFHIWDAEYIWLSRIRGVSLSAFPSKNFGDDVSISKFLECSKEFRDFVAEQDRYFWDKKCTYTNLQQTEFISSIPEIIMHCMNHSTYHRGQLVTLLRQVGIETLPSTDLIAYFRQ